MQLTVDLKVISVGQGIIEDNNQEWAKLVAFSGEVKDADGYTGSLINEYPVVDQNGKPSRIAAQEISRELAKNLKVGGTDIKLTACLVTKAKKSVVAITGLAVPSSKAA